MGLPRHPMTPGVAVLKQCYEKGKLAGKRAKVYNQDSRHAALGRFVVRYSVLDDREGKSWWLDGWHDAGLYRKDTVS